MLILMKQMRFINEQDKKYDSNKVKIFLNWFLIVMLSLKNNRTRFCFKRFLESVIGEFRNDGYQFDYFEEKDINTVVDKRDRTYQFHMKHNLCALEWMIYKKVNKNKALINNFPRDWRHSKN